MNKNGCFGLLEIAATVKNLQQHLPNCYLQKFYRLPQKGNKHPKSFLFRFSSKGYRRLMIEIGNRVHMLPDDLSSTTIYDDRLPRDGFCSKLKKHLDNGRVVGINYTEGAKYFEIEFTHYLLCFDFYGQGNLVLTDKKNVIISWHPAIKPGEILKKDLTELPPLEHQPNGKGYILDNLVYTYKIDNATSYETFGEAVFEIKDKLARSKLLPPKSKKKKPPTDYRQLQANSWQKKVIQYTQACEWLGENSYLSLDECIKKKPPEIKLPFKETILTSISPLL